MSKRNKRLRAVRGLLTAFAVSLSGCVSLPKEEPGGNRPFRLQMEEVEHDRLPEQSPQWGLALSGGGLRSALFSIGAMKALYDNGVFEDTKVISTVSGGGYAAYWLYSNHRDPANTSPLFGFTSLDNSQFDRRVCELITTANFVPFPAMLARGFYPVGAVRLYDRAIWRTFGRSDDLEHPTRFRAFRSDVEAGRTPYWIVNATLIAPRPTGWSDGLYEFTPYFAGNEEYGYTPWDGSMPVRTAVSASGAAFQLFLKQGFDSPNPRLRGRKTVVADGGASENLGAIALIRRGIPNIVIVDAEHDPGYRFGAYVNLRDRLKQWGLTLRIVDIEDHLTAGGGPVLQRAVHVGHVRKLDAPNDPPVSTIRYIKMALPETVRARFDNAEAIEVGKARDKRFYTAFDSASRGGMTDCNKRWSRAPTYRIGSSIMSPCIPASCKRTATRDSASTFITTSCARIILNISHPTRAFTRIRRLPSSDLATLKPQS